MLEGPPRATCHGPVTTTHAAPRASSPGPHRLTPGPPEQARLQQSTEAKAAAQSSSTVKSSITHSSP